MILSHVYLYAHTPTLARYLVFFSALLLSLVTLRFVEIISSYRLVFFHIRRTFCSRRARSLFLLFSSLGVRIGVFGLCFFSAQLNGRVTLVLVSVVVRLAWMLEWCVDCLLCAVNDALGRSIGTHFSVPYSSHSGCRRLLAAP